MSQTQAVFLIFGVAIFAMCLIGIALSGYGSPDRSREKQHLPGHDVQNNRSDPRS
ncbi:MAG: hypothetical protein JWQ70_38 [Aeromicrobium sp.]|nr:hypothetical protein [Aeromicrobium sp.]